MWRRSLSCNIIPVWNKSRNKSIMPAHKANKTENKIEQLKINKCRTAICVRFTNHILAQCFLLADRWPPSMFECFRHREEREGKTEAVGVALGELRPHQGVMKHWGRWRKHSHPWKEAGVWQGRVLQVHPSCPAPSLLPRKLLPAKSTTKAVHCWLVWFQPDVSSSKVHKWVQRRWELRRHKGEAPF